jgi:hypothetical protein
MQNSKEKSGFGGDASLALAESLIAHESIESFLDEMEGSGFAGIMGDVPAASIHFTANR